MMSAEKPNTKSRRRYKTVRTTSLDLDKLKDIKVPPAVKKTIRQIVTLSGQGLKQKQIAKELQKTEGYVSDCLLLMTIEDSLIPIVNRLNTSSLPYIIRVLRAFMQYPEETTQWLVACEKRGGKIRFPDIALLNTQIQELKKSAPNAVSYHQNNVVPLNSPEIRVKFFGKPGILNLTRKGPPGMAWVTFPYSNTEQLVLLKQLKVYNVDCACQQCPTCAKPTKKSSDRLK